VENYAVCGEPVEACDPPQMVERFELF